MGQQQSKQQSKDELLYQQVNYGNVEGIKALHSQGAGLEWIDSEHKTPLIVACLNPQLYNVAKTLIELGANVNAYRPGRHAGSPLHHAAKRGLEQHVRLLLSHGANALVMNDACQTPLDVARAKGYGNVVRAIEDHVCLFSGWLRELYGPGFLELLAPQLLSRKVWTVVLPGGSCNLRGSAKLKLAVYASPQDAQPRMIVQLWKANLDEPNFNQPDPAAVITDVSRSTRIKLAPISESEKHQLQRFCNACKGIPQVMHPLVPFNDHVPTAPAAAEDEELAMAINASLQSAGHERSHAHSYIGSGVDASTSTANSMNSSNQDESYITGKTSTSHEASGSKCEIQQDLQHDNGVPSIVETTLDNPHPTSTPSAPPIADADIDDGPIVYPSIDTSHIDLSSPIVDDDISSQANEKQVNEATSSCTICLDAPLEGACIPCGHMAGCMSCLNEIKVKKWGCPVCRSKIAQVIRIYAV